MELKANDHVRMTIVTRVPASTRTFTARVTWVEQCCGGAFQYFGYVPDDTGKNGAFGAARWYADQRSNHLWGLVKLEVIGTLTPAQQDKRWSPKPGNTGYDLMC